MKKKHIPWVVILLVLFLDQLSKVLVKTNMTLGQSIPVLGDWFYLHFTENVGMAFGFELGFTYGKLALSLFRLAAIAGISWYIARLIRRGATRGLIICLSLILAGAIGNVIDSAFFGLIFSASHFNQVAVFLPEGGGYAPFLHGKVVDMLYFPLINTTWPEWVPMLGGSRLVFFQPVFNLADASITVGVFSMLIFQKRLFAFQAAGSQHAVGKDEPGDDPSTQDVSEDTGGPDAPVKADNPEPDTSASGGEAETDAPASGGHPQKDAQAGSDCPKKDTPLDSSDGPQTDAPGNGDEPRPDMIT